MEKDPNINPELLELLWLAKLQKTQENSQEEESLRLEYSSQKHISFSRSKEVAYQQDLLSLVEQQHINNCSHCEARLRGFQRHTHPLNSLLFIYKAGLASETLKEALRTHLDNDCFQCEEKINGWLGKLANKLKNIVEINKTFFDYICYQLDNNFNISSKELAFVGSYTSKSQQVTESLDMKIKLENLPLNVYLQEFPDNKLRVAISGIQTSVKYVYIQIIGQDKTFLTIIALAIKNQKIAGETFLPNFNEIIQQLGEKFYITAFPIDEPAYKEISSLFS